MTDDPIDDGDDHGGSDAGAAPDGGREAVARSYYESLDAGAYDALRALLAPGFVQRRPDRSFEGRDAFVAFVRDDRPRTETTHAVDAVYGRTAGGDESGTGAGDAAAGDAIAVRGRLLDADGSDLFGFVDVHRFEGGRIAETLTYTR